jgi:cyclase
VTLLQFHVMRNVRVWLAAGFTAALSLTFVLTRGEAQPNTLKKVVDGVWFREGDLLKLGHCNNTIIEMKDYLIVVDANFPSGARLALEEARKVSSKPVKYVFDTHHHGDHAYGNPVWTEMGAITLAYVGVADELKRYEPKRFQESAKQRPDVAALNRDAPEPPKQTFSKSPYVLSDATRRVEFHFFGWAHTRGDGFVFLPKEKVLCTGDAAVNGPYNFTGDGNIGNWPKVMEAAEKLGPQYVLPGHGGMGGSEILRGQREFMSALRKAVLAAIDQGKKLDEIVTKDGEKQSTSIQLAEGVKNWVGPGLAAQVRDAYEEIAQNKPHGDIAH